MITGTVLECVSHENLMNICIVKQQAVLSITAVSMIGLFSMKIDVGSLKAFSLPSVPSVWDLRGHLIPLRS